MWTAASLIGRFCHLVWHWRGLVRDLVAIHWEELARLLMCLFIDALCFVIGVFLTTFVWSFMQQYERRRNTNAELFCECSTKTTTIDDISSSLVHQFIN
jgi:hypothetical protein